MNIELWLQRTMVLERLSGVLLYVLVTFFAYSRIQHTSDSRKMKRIFNGLLVALCVMSFIYIPGQAADLCEWQNIYREYWVDLSVTEFIKGPMLRSNTPLSYLVIYLCEKTTLSGLLPMVSAFFFYKCIFSVMQSCFERNTLPVESKLQDSNSLFKTDFDRRTNATMALALTFLVFSASGVFLEVISGLRSLTAFAILAWCFYGEMVGERTFLKNLLIYCMACLIHLAVIPLLAFRILYLLVGQLGHKAPKLGSYAAAIALCVGGLVFGKDLIIAVLNKGDRYLSNEYYSYIWEYIIGFLQLLAMYITLFKYRKIKDEPEAAKLRPLAEFNALLCVAETCLCFEYTIFHRFVIFSSMLIIPVMYVVLQTEMRDNSKSTYRRLIQIICAAMFLLACVRGNLCGYKFFLLSD